MKYIRTKEHGVCKVVMEDKYTISYENKDVLGCMVKDAYETQQADNLEELCDTIAIVWKDHLPTIWNDVAHFKDLLSMYSSYQRKHKIVAIYGAIWTDKGLIYVAKMNEKGELELL